MKDAVAVAASEIVVGTPVTTTFNAVAQAPLEVANAHSTLFNELFIALGIEDEKTPTCGIFASRPVSPELQAGTAFNTITSFFETFKEQQDKISFEQQKDYLITLFMLLPYNSGGTTLSHTPTHLIPAKIKRTLPHHAEDMVNALRQAKGPQQLSHTLTAFKPKPRYNRQGPTECCGRSDETEQLYYGLTQSIRKHVGPHPFSREWKMTFPKDYRPRITNNHALDTATTIAVAAVAVVAAAETVYVAAEVASCCLQQ